MDAELALYNKIGDLYTKLNKGAEAADMYEKAVKRYIGSGPRQQRHRSLQQDSPHRPWPYPYLSQTRAAHGAARAAG